MEWLVVSAPLPTVLPYELVSPKLTFPVAARSVVHEIVAELVDGDAAIALITGPMFRK